MILMYERATSIKLNNLDTSKISGLPYSDIIRMENTKLDFRPENIETTWALMESGDSVNRSYKGFPQLSKYGSAYDVPQPCYTLKQKNMSVREMINKGLFSATNSANTLPEDWATLWDAMRIDISIRRAAMGTIRQLIYNVVQMPDSDLLFAIQEFFPYALVFKEHNGRGEAVRQGEALLGQKDTVRHAIYAAGFEWDLLSALFNRAADPQRVTDAVVFGSTLLQDDLAIRPILTHTYSVAAKTPAATLSGAGRQELLYLTLENAVEALSQRKDPITGERIGASDFIILASSIDARRIAKVISGLPSVNERYYPAISEIRSIISYDSESIIGRLETTTYPGVTPGKCYLIRRNRYMNIGIKRGVVMEVDPQPNVKTLSRETRSWYFVEGSYNSPGIENFIQEITLPAWVE